MFYARYLDETFLNFINLFFNCYIVQEPETITDNAPTALQAVQMNPKDYADSEIKRHPTFPWDISLFVLVLAGAELIFFIVACMGLCFGFVLKTVWIIQGCFGYC